MQQRLIKIIVFDLVGVLFVVDTAKALRTIGLHTIVLYYLRHFSNPFVDSLSLLNKMRLEMPGEFQELVAYKGTYLPLCMLEWQRGRMTSKEALDRVLSFYDMLDAQNYFHDQRQKKTLIVFAQLILGSSVGSEIFRPIEYVESLITSLKENYQYKLYILSNIDKETFEAQKMLYKNFFGLFDGIVTSYETQLLKPEVTIYHYLLDTYNLAPHQCCYIDDQPENLLTAQTLGMMTILCKKASRLKTLLKDYGIL